MSYGYGGRPNPFDQRDGSSGGGGGGGYGAPARAPPPGSFGQGPRPGGGGGGPPRYNQGPAMGRDNYGSGNVEMSSLTQNAGSFGSGNPNAILDECRSIDQGIDRIEGNLRQLQMLQDRSLNEAESSGTSTSRQIDSLSSETMSMYRSLTDRVRTVKSQRDAQQARNSGQVGRVDRRLKQAIQQYQQVESAFRKKTQDQMARQYRIVRPQAPEYEVREAVEDASVGGGGQVFQQAMMQSGRQGQARAVLSAVQDRQAALQRIEQQMIELAQLFQDMDTLVVQQEVQVTQIEQKGEEVVENLDKGNEEIGTAVVSAKRTRKNKWICLGVTVAIILIIGIAVTAYIMVQRAQNGNKKRSVVARDVLFAGEAPVVDVYAQSKIVVPESDSAPLSRFGAGRRKARYVLNEANSGQENDKSVGKRYVLNEEFSGQDNDKSIGKRYVLNEEFSGQDNDKSVGKRYVLNEEFSGQDNDKSVGKRYVLNEDFSGQENDKSIGKRYVLNEDFSGQENDKSIGKRYVLNVEYSGQEHDKSLGKRYVLNTDFTLDDDSDAPLVGRTIPLRIGVPVFADGEDGGGGN